ncbi:serine/threonine-protein kinase [Nocardia sp. XZ_19_385]|uniref:serine/threonine-protein kinase n=1 Tax=Nocardia sp. XZ_19_385 TaxID=2769488 RepID=UPI00188F4B1E|nr:serine/threonine-protein kinase [Nocardia sp. XZ_19_385]
MRPGTIVGGYRIERVLGAGGMGTVYLAQHPSLPRTDAIKVLSVEHTADDEFRARFEREANLAAGLDHPNIVSVYNRGEEHGQLWIAMQYVRGTDVAAVLERDPRSMNPVRALRIITEVGKGLDYAHRKGLLHRDIKPANFLLSHEDDDEERVLLTDFGVAKSSDDANELTQTGTFLATIAYASPEQLSGERLDPRSDIYSLACSLYKLLTGQNPYPGAQPAMVMMGHLQQPPPRASAVHPGLPVALDQVFARAMAKNPAERYATCREFTDAAARALGGEAPPQTSPTYPIQAAAPGYPAHSMAAPPTDRWTSTALSPSETRASSKRWIAIAAAVVVVVLAIGGSIWFAGRDNSPAATAATPSAEPSSSLPPKEQARSDNPKFAGKQILMVNISGTGREEEPEMEIFLPSSRPTDFLAELGFVYNQFYVRKRDEQTLRAVPKDQYSTAFNAVTSGYILAVRSDARAGGGGLLGLPHGLLTARATVLVVDDAQAVNALRYWSSDSEQVLLSKLVPVLKAGVQ